MCPKLFEGTQLDPANLRACRVLFEALCHACVAADSAVEETRSEQSGRWAAIRSLAASGVRGAPVDAALAESLRRVEQAAGAEAARAGAEDRAASSDFSGAAELQEEAVAMAEAAGVSPETLSRERARLNVLRIAHDGAARSAAITREVAANREKPRPAPVELPDILAGGNYPP